MARYVKRLTLKVVVVPGHGTKGHRKKVPPLIDPSTVSSSASEMEASSAPTPSRASPLAVTLAPMLVRDLLPLLENLSEAQGGTDAGKKDETES